METRRKTKKIRYSEEFKKENPRKEVHEKKSGRKIKVEERE